LEWYDTKKSREQLADERDQSWSKATRLEAEAERLRGETLRLQEIEGRKRAADARVAELYQENERLRREGQYQSDEADRLGFKLAKAEAEIKRLRATLDGADECLGQYYQYGNIPDSALKKYHQAREALGETSEEA
jgi:predicted RNase H-like nuclease (RuvC/YqgF family)